MEIVTAKYMFDGEQLLTNKAALIKGNVVIDFDSINDIKKSHSSLRIKDFGEGVLFPGFVNLHTHLELSYLKNKLPQNKGFMEWLKNIIMKKKDDIDSSTIGKAIKSGVNELYKSGVRIVGDISNTLISCPYLEQYMPQSVVFFEQYALNKKKACEVRNNFNKNIQTARRKYRDLIISPAVHSIYSTHSCLINYLSHFDKELPCSMHFLESRDEKDFLESKGGLFELLNDLGLIDDKLHYEGIFNYLNDVHSLRQNMIFVHCTYADKNEIEQIKQLSGNVCLCLRSNQYISNELPDVYMIEKSGVNIGIGTDSLSSNWDLNFLNELSFIHNKFDKLRPEVIFRWATKDGAKALNINLGFKKGYTAYSVFIPAYTNSPLKEILSKEGRK